MLQNTGKDKMTIAYQGVPGSFSYEAAESYFDEEIELQPHKQFADAGSAVIAGQADLAILPVENSSTGTISEVYDLLLREKELWICGEVTLAVRHCLLGVPGTSLEKIIEVRSHPQGLLQCSAFINRHNYLRVPGMNTAICAAEISALGDERIAAIASRAAAKAYGLEVLAEDINDAAQNATRFVVVGNKRQTFGSKTSVVFNLSHLPGSLYNSLGSFAKKGVDLLRIESRPLPERPFEYSFIVDVAGDASTSPLAEALADLQNHVSYLRILGSYNPK